MSEVNASSENFDVPRADLAVQILANEIVERLGERMATVFAEHHGRHAEDERLPNVVCVDFLHGDLVGVDDAVDQSLPLAALILQRPAPREVEDSFDDQDAHGSVRWLDGTRDHGVFERG